MLTKKTKLKSILKSHISYVMIFSFAVFFTAFKFSDSPKHLFILSGQSNMARLDINESFVPAIEKEYGSSNVLFVKDAKGSQPIRRWYKQWASPQGENSELDTELYDRLLSKVNSEIEGKEIKTITFIWMQGERDATEAYGDVYEQSLKGLYKQLCSDLGNDEINFVIGRINDFDMGNKRKPHWTKVRDIQVKVGESNPRFSWVNTDDLNEGISSKGKEINNDLHMSVKGYQTLGKRFAEKSIYLINNN